MGYESTVTGDISFTRAGDEAATQVLSNRVLEELQGSNRFYNLQYFFAINHDGLLSMGQRAKTYDLADELQQMIELVAKDGASVHGALLIEGAERGDLWRIVVQGSVLREEHAVVTVTWPDGMNQNL